MAVIPTPGSEKHLHMRGENPTYLVRRCRPAETPPHAWRKPSPTLRTRLTTRNTSTCVEKTTRSSLSRSGGQKHLHMRGENPCGRALLTHRRETPPHAWRKPVSRLSRTTWTRNTSTCVEKTIMRIERRRLREKHLHMRGETSDMIHNLLFFRNTSTCVEKTKTGGLNRNKRKETPPHAWRKPTISFFCCPITRNTSTCVEKTTSSTRCFFTWKKHLHMRGENKKMQNSLTRTRETPPHAWRKRMPDDAYSCVGGNTSTCVEKTRPRLNRSTPRRKHLHMRGENPPVREVIRYKKGNTSTCVEKTIWQTMVTTPLEKHLHMRGENVCAWPPVCRGLETPPHAWRKLSWDARRRLLLWKHLHMRGENSQAYAMTVDSPETPPHAWRKHQDIL